MTWKLFYELTEIYTTPLDVMWFVFAIAYSDYRFGEFNFFYGIIGFICVFCFHLLINMHNNYMDYKNAKDEEGYKKKVSTIGTNNIALKTVRNWILGLSILPLIASLWLVYQTSWITLVIGIVCVLIGIFYSYGPRPINSLPIAEVTIALAITFFIPLVYIYLGMSDRSALTWSAIWRIFITDLPNILILMTLLLSNNISDLTEDIKNGRHTLVYYLGKSKALKFYELIWIIAAVLVIILVIFGLLPITSLLMVLIYPKIYQTLKPFLSKQIKKVTYFSALKAVNLFEFSSILLFAAFVLVSKIL
ncbi:prenyltransferase [Lactobacillus sp. YT155]|uniref:prenyltransferase n=1 Tax=Lactobacillus sp. YT155 TaxID=3060955 RepID=UPI00265FFE8A|nr:prenyltransferase [Lactobacillus sp. YT155]MDO1605641.1 prenyltransferase [Lactobacillus sp. YT155]